MDKAIIENCFQPILNKHCWNVTKGIGSFITFEFGNPKLELTTPKLWKGMNYPLNQQRIRRVSIKGTHMLWIYCCSWEIKASKIKIAFEESPDKEIHKATQYLNGQKLVELIIDEKSNETRFRFDLGGELISFDEEGYKLGTEMWSLYMYSSEQVLSMNNLRQIQISDLNKTLDPKNYRFLDKTEIRIPITNR